MNLIPYGKQVIEKEDIDAVVEVLKSDFLTQGPQVAKFERSVTDFLKSVSHDPTEIYALAVNNGTTALHLACIALGLKAGDKVLVTSNSFAASANCVRYCGANVEFVDIDPKTLCLDPNHLQFLIQSQPPGTYKGIIVVDFAGFMADLEQLQKIADQNQLWIIEDACHAIGGTRRASDGSLYTAGNGRFADIATYSFHPVKHVATGEGGMILTRSRELLQKLTLLRTHGITKDPSLLHRNDGGWYYEMQVLGHNGRISDILCALGASQMKRMEPNLARRRAIADRYDRELSGLPITLPIRHPDVEHAYHLYVIQTDQRKALYDFLISKKINPQVHYIPIHRLPYYEELYGKISRPVCEAYYDRCLSIPMYHGLTDEDQTRVIHEIKNFFGK
jgi:UDP-4-amino-4,6-dideoxy-N-acetyl-beta-L-altrosamine transaminase